MNSHSQRNTPPVLRWLSVVLRGLHLAAVVSLGAAFLGASLSVQQQSLAVFISGFAMLIVDAWCKPSMLWEWSGAALIMKLAMVVWMGLDAELSLPIFWLVLVWSAIFAHAPASFRHKSWRG